MSEIIPDIEDQEDAVADRGIPSLDSNYRASGRRTKGLIIAGAASFAIALICIGGLFLAKAFHTWRDKQAARESITVDQPARLKPLPEATADTPPLPDSMQGTAQGGGNEPPPTGPKMTPGVAQATAETQRPGAVGNGQPQLSPEEQRRLAEEQRRQQVAQADVMAFGRPSNGNGDVGNGGSVALGRSSDSGDIADVLKAQFQAQNKPAQTTPTLGDSLKTTATDAAAAVLGSDPSLTMAKGTILTCALDTALDSTVPGMTKCYLTEDVYSADGKTVLAERGSMLTGQYESGSLKAGMNRIFLLWTELRSIHGVRVNLASPATDALGRSGVDGIINNHFWERFGAGLLLSVVDDVTASFANRNSTGGSVQFTGTADEGKQAASIALEHSVDIPPTLSKDQGSIVKVFVARDLYFGNVYGFRTAQR